LRNLNHLDRFFVERIVQTYIDEIEAKHTGESVKQSTNNPRSVAAAPDSRKCKHADQIIDAASETLNFFG
jgi:hypothetical protein